MFTVTPLPLLPLLPRCGLKSSSSCSPKQTQGRSSPKGLIKLADNLLGSVGNLQEPWSCHASPEWTCSLVYLLDMAHGPARRRLLYSFLRSEPFPAQKGLEGQHPRHSGRSTVGNSPKSSLRPNIITLSFLYLLLSMKSWILLRNSPGVTFLLLSKSDLGHFLALSQTAWPTWPHRSRVLQRRLFN